MQVLNSREPLPATQVTAYRAWIEALTAEDFEGSLLPALVRMSKRSPESVVRSTALLLSMLKLDSSSFAPSLAKDMLSMVRHPKENVRYALTML